MSPHKVNLTEADTTHHYGTPVSLMPKILTQQTGAYDHVLSLQQGQRLFEAVRLRLGERFLHLSLTAGFKISEFSMDALR